MAEFPALPLWTDAYLGDTMHLTTIEHGAYILLLMSAWRTRGCVLPNDDKLLARYARCTPAQWRRLRPVIASFFSISSDGWRQARLTDEAIRVRQIRETQAANGRASALKRKGRHLTDRIDDREPSDNLDASSTDREPRIIVNGSSTPTPIPTTLSKDNEDLDDPHRHFWTEAKAFIKPEVKGDPGSLIGKWVKEYGQSEVRSAVTRAQLERPVNRIEFIVGCLRRSRDNGYGAGHSGIPL